jgi:hypothetical protein
MPGRDAQRATGYGLELWIEFNNSDTDNCAGGHQAACAP